MSHPVLPDTLESAIAQAIHSLNLALDDRVGRILIDLKFDELKPLPVARELVTFLLDRYGKNWQALFADAGMAALAQRDWLDLVEKYELTFRGINEGRAALRDEDQAFLLVAPSAVEVDLLEKLLALAGDRPFILFNPRLESAEIGIGLTARRLRARFINTFQVIYYLQPLEQGALWRAYPHQWQLWQNPAIPETTMRLVYESVDRPSLEEIFQRLRQKTGRSPSFLQRLQNFMDALRQ
jgi:hypothetical protein